MDKTKLNIRLLGIADLAVGLYFWHMASGHFFRAVRMLLSPDIPLDMASFSTAIICGSWLLMGTFATMAGIGLLFLRPYGRKAHIYGVVPCALLVPLSFMAIAFVMISRKVQIDLLSWGSVFILAFVASLTIVPVLILNSRGSRDQLLSGQISDTNTERRATKVMFTILILLTLAVALVTYFIPLG